MIGLAGYVLMPTAPPRLLSIGFVDNHKDGLVQLAANPYAAMPSLHAADAIIVGVVFAFLCRHWLAKIFWAIWPAWVWFAVMATGNHFWLDCLAGLGVALVALAVVYRQSVLQVVAARRA
jgi:membrane-associated phospholipid phosphatase